MMRKRAPARSWRLPGVAPSLCRSLTCVPEPTAPDADFAIAPATVLPMESERTLPDHTVVVRDGGVGTLPSPDFGVTAPGERADLALPEAGPVENIEATREIAAAISGDRYPSATEIGAELEAIAGRRASRN